MKATEVRWMDWQAIP